MSMNTFDTRRKPMRKFVILAGPKNRCSYKCTRVREGHSHTTYVEAAKSCFFFREDKDL